MRIFLSFFLLSFSLSCGREGVELELMAGGAVLALLHLVELHVEVDGIGVSHAIQRWWA